MTKKAFYRFNGVLALLVCLLTFTACPLDDDEKDKDNGGGSGTVDPRLGQVIPDEYRNQMARYIPIYDGVNPPSVEGVYVSSPEVLVYDTGSGTTEAGHVYGDYYFKFTNQNGTKNTLDYSYYGAGGRDTGTGRGAYISGEGNNFTIFSAQEGVSDGIRYKVVKVISATVTSGALKNFYEAFLMKEKSGDPKNTLMPVGAFRVTKDGDGLAETATWPVSARGFEAATEYPGAGEPVFFNSLNN